MDRLLEERDASNSTGKGRQQVFVTHRYLYTRLHGASRLRMYSSCREIIKSNIRMK